MQKSGAHNEVKPCPVQVTITVDTLESHHSLGAMHIAIAQRHGNLLDGCVGGRELYLMSKWFFEVLSVSSNSELVIGGIKFQLVNGFIARTGIVVLQTRSKTIIIGRHIEEIHGSIKLVVRTI